MTSIVPTGTFITTEGYYASNTHGFSTYKSTPPVYGYNNNKPNYIEKYGSYFDWVDSWDGYDLDDNIDSGRGFKYTWSEYSLKYNKKVNRGLYFFYRYTSAATFRIIRRFNRSTGFTQHYEVSQLNNERLDEKFSYPAWAGDYNSLGLFSRIVAIPKHRKVTRSEFIANIHKAIEHQKNKGLLQNNTETALKNNISLYFPNTLGIFGLAL